jgi:acid phosphatase (class A)
MGKRIMGRVLITILAAASASVAVYAAQQQAERSAASARSMPPGYLAREAVPDSLLLDPPPPAPGSAALARDEEAARAAVALRGTPRWDQARIDADLFTPTSTSTFSCAAGVPIGKDTTPKLDALMRKVGPDLGMSVYPTKRHYSRPRPFMVNNQPTCTPEMEDVLRKDGSYPSGHSAIGYGWGLVLAEVVPERAAQLVARGRAFGDSRRVCNVHWLSDVEEGRVVASAVVARLHAEAAFRADVEAARAEVAALRAKAPTVDCAKETAAFAGS